MRIKDVDFDERLLNAQRQNSLVIFAGAGVSIGPPSNYPSFNGLTAEIAKWAGQVWPEKEPSERFLGRLVYQNIKVHNQVAHLLSSPESKPKPLHEDLLRLFGNLEQVRIVTTNFDSHFETAANNVFHRIPEVFKAPALPLGNDFSGIVYLHGSVLADPRRMVLTDQDFGRAYLTEGWATRFLQSMFSQYTVLFIGYSHNDTVMHYLSRGLPPENTKLRFALIRADDNCEDWIYRGMKPLPYPFDGENDYSQLGEAVSGWVEWAHRGALDTELRIKELVEGPPPLDQESQDFIIWAVNDPVAVRFIRRHAKKAEWLTWIAERGSLKPLFSYGDLSPQAQELSFWIAENFAVKHPDTVFAILEQHSKTLNPQFAFEIARHLGNGGIPPDQDPISRWIPILLENKTIGYHFEFISLLKHALRQGAITAAVQLFEYLTKPRLILKKGIVWSEEDASKDFKTDIDLAFYRDHSLLNKIWEDEAKSVLPELASFLLPAMIQNINCAYLLFNSWKKAESSWDPLNWHRAAIEPHEQDKYSHAEDIMINITRDCLEWVIGNMPLAGQAWIEALIEMKPILLRRLAVHGLTSATRIDSNEKIRWLLNKDLLLAPGLKHEVFQLLKKSYPNANQATRKELIEAALAKFNAMAEEDEADKGRKEYDKFNLLHWLSQADPKCQEVTGRLEEIRRAYPQFRVRKYPDLDHWSSGARWVGPRSPLTVEELLGKQPQEWLEYFLSFKEERFEGPDRDGLLHFIGEAVQRDFSWGRELTRVLIDQGDYTLDLWESLIRGWQGAKLSFDQWDYVLSVLDNAGLVQKYSHIISDLLERGAEKEESGIPISLFDKADGIAQKIWASPDTINEIGIRDWLGRAINHLGGKLALFWLHALSRSRKEIEREDGIPQPYKNRFEMIVDTDDKASTFGRVVLTGQLAFLYSVDSNWARAKLIPLLDWSRDVQRARQAWDGWLGWGQLGEPLLSELLPLYRQAFSFLASELKEERHRFVEHVVVISLFMLNDPLETAGYWIFCDQLKKKIVSALPLKSAIA